MAYDNEGGPAFPHKTVEWDKHDATEVYYSGMSLRDYFAAHAPPPPYDGSLVDDKSPIETQLARAARWAFDWAEAMLAESRRRQATASEGDAS